LVYQGAYSIRLGTKRRDDADRALISLLDDELPDLGNDRSGFGRIERAASHRPDHLASYLDPSHGRSRCLRPLQNLVIRRDAETAAIEMAVGKRNDIAVRAMVVA